MTKSFKFWQNIVIITSIFILLVVGFMAGRMTLNKKSEECLTNPLVYGVGLLEEVNDNVNFTCSCRTYDKPIKPFFFDDQGLYEENPISTLQASDFQILPVQ